MTPREVSLTIRKGKRCLQGYAWSRYELATGDERTKNCLSYAGVKRVYARFWHDNERFAGIRDKWLCVCRMKDGSVRSISV